MHIQQLPAVIKQMIPSAQLPILYENAVRDLRECERIEFCKDVSDKAVAIAVLAKLKGDTRARDVAVRIQVRAQERIGELLLEIPGFLGSKKKPNLRREAAERAGLTPRASSEAVRIAKVPKGVRDEMIEKTPPIAAAQLAWMATPHRPHIPKSQEEKAADQLDHWVCYFEDAEALAQEVPAKEFAQRLARDHSDDVEFLPQLRARIVRLEKWLEEFKLAIVRVN